MKPICCAVVTKHSSGGIPSSPEGRKVWSKLRLKSENIKEENNAGNRLGDAPQEKQLGGDGGGGAGVIIKAPCAQTAHSACRFAAKIFRSIVRISPWLNVVQNHAGNVSDICVLTLTGPGLYCDTSIDGIGTCWPRSSAGQMVSRPCPEMFYGVRYNTTSKYHTVVKKKTKEDLIWSHAFPRLLPQTLLPPRANPLYVYSERGRREAQI